MIIQPQFLSEQIKKTSSNVFFIYGEEPLQHLESLNCIEEHSIKAGYQKELTCEANAHFDFDFLSEQIQSLSLFSEKRLFKIHLTDFALKGTFMNTLLERLTHSTDKWLIIYPKYDAKILKAPWYNTLVQKYCVIPCRPLNRQETAQWIKQRLSADPQTLQFLLEKTEGSLLATHQAIEKLKLLSEKPTLQLCQTLLQDDTQFSLFELIDALLERSPKRVFQIFNRLQQEGIDPILILWAITRVLRQVYAILAKLNHAEVQTQSLQSFGVWKSKERLFRHFIAHTPKSVLLQGLADAQKLDSRLKSYTNRSLWRTLLRLCLNFTGVEHYAVE